MIGRYLNPHQSVLGHSRYNGFVAMVDVAQLVESQIVVLVVVGSSPTSHPPQQPPLRVAVLRRVRSHYLEWGTGFPQTPLPY